MANVRLSVCTSALPCTTQQWPSTRSDRQGAYRPSAKAAHKEVDATPEPSMRPRDILEDLTVAQVFRFKTIPQLVSRVGRQAASPGPLRSEVWVGNLDGNAVAVKRLSGWNAPDVTSEDRARALIGMIINHPSSFVNYFGYLVVEVAEDRARRMHPMVRLVDDGELERSNLSPELDGLRSANIGAVPFAEGPANGGARVRNDPHLLNGESGNVSP